MFTRMRCAFGCERVRVNADSWRKGAIPAGTLSARDTLEMATRNSAYTVGLEDRVGSLLRSRPTSC
jgi:predicted amidohydrolase YtcJ